MKLFFCSAAILCVLSFLICSSCLGYRSPRYIELAHEITSETGKKLKKQKNLYLAGTGGQMMNDIQVMFMDFEYYQEVDLKEARELLVCAVREYLSAINNNKEVRPYLHEYPFTAKNIEIIILIYNKDRTDPPPEKIDCIQCIDGTLEYYLARNPDQAMHKESYEEALQAIAAQ